MLLLPPRSTRPDALFPCTTLFRSPWLLFQGVVEVLLNALRLPQGILSFVNELEQGIDTVPLAAIILKSVTLFDRGKFNEIGCDDVERFRIMPEFAQANQHFSRSEEHTSELQSIMRISYAVFCLKTTNNIKNKTIDMSIKTNRE